MYTWEEGFPLTLRASHLAATPVLRSNIHILRLKGTKESSSSYLPRCGLWSSLFVPPRHTAASTGAAWLQAWVLASLLFPVQCLGDIKPILWGTVDLWSFHVPRRPWEPFLGASWVCQEALSIPHCGQTQKASSHSALSRIRQCQGRGDVPQGHRRVFPLAKTNLVP